VPWQWPAGRDTPARTSRCMATNSIRTFIAFKLPAECLQLAGELQTRLKGDGFKLRWVRPHNIHLTIKFLGELPDHRVADVRAAMQTAAKDFAPLALTVQGMGVFPSFRRPSVLWLGIGGQVGLLEQVHGRLEAQLETLGIEKENRPFKGHLTLARIKQKLDAERLRQSVQAVGQFAPRPFAASELIFFQSQLRPGGAIYTPLETVVLG
jgi:RNA 2',3'-cyclic 3'-phosphodiesterase